jgi:hypothetical protein
MPALTDLFVNGDFEDAPPSWNGTAPWIIVSGAPGTFVGWTGSDIEWGRESVYRSGGSTANRIIEMDGNSGAITEIRQSFSITGEVNATLSFDMALRAGQPLTAGEGFTVTIRDSLGNIILSQTYLPTSFAWQTVSQTVPFLVGGTYTISFTEVGTNNSLGALLDNVSMIVCFTAGTLIDTPDGPRPVEDLLPGDLVLTADDGPQPVRWVGQRRVAWHDMLRDPRLRPVTIVAGAFGEGLPRRDLAVSRQHRILRTGWACELHFALPEVLVPAHRLVNGRTVRHDLPAGDVTYVHFLCDRHQIVRSEGLASESFYPSPLSLTGVEAAAQEELLLIFPQLRDLAAPPLDFARPVIDGKVARLVA